MPQYACCECNYEFEGGDGVCPHCGLPAELLETRDDPLAGGQSTYPPTLMSQYSSDDGLEKPPPTNELNEEEY